MSGIIGRNDRPGITGASGEITPWVRRQLAENGFTEAEFLAARERVAERDAGARRIRKMELHLEEWNRILREGFEYEKRQREERAKGR
jgi:hypothetical protein